MTAPHPDQQQLTNELLATAIKPLIAIAANPHEEPTRRTLALHIATELSPQVTATALIGLLGSTINALSQHHHQPPTFFLESWISSSGTQNHRDTSIEG